MEPAKTAFVSGLNDVLLAGSLLLVVGALAAVILLRTPAPAPDSGDRERLSRSGASKPLSGGRARRRMVDSLRMPAASTTATSSEYAPGAFGFPRIVPSPSTRSGAGRPLTDTRYGGVPPVMRSRST